MAAVLIICACACAPPAVAHAAKPVLDEPPREGPYPRAEFASVAVSDDGCHLQDAAGGGEGWTPDLDLRGDAGFEPASLPPVVRCWYEELWRVIGSPERSEYFTSRAARNDLYTYAREVNTHLVALLTAFRVTGDLALLDEVDRLAQHMRAQLSDAWQGRHRSDSDAVDGYYNWIWDRGTSSTHDGRDIHEIDEMRTHSVLAHVAYAFARNSELESPNGVVYAERADFWLDYLANHFEAKWRERNGVPWPRFPFMERPHLHETLEFARYHHYMGLLTGEDAYAAEAERLSEVAFENFREAETDNGPALVTPRSVLSMGGTLEYLLPSTYFRYVVATAVDLHLEGVGPWADVDVIESLARSLAEFVLDGEGGGYARDIGGGQDRAGIDASREREWSRVSTGTFNSSPFALLAAWDASGKVAETSMAVHLHRGPQEWNVHMPAGLLLHAALTGESVASAD